MSLVWKLLRSHVSVPQLSGFFFANLFGMFIVLLGFQFYRDVLPVFTAQDSFMRSDYLILSKKVGTASALSGRTHSFGGAECDDVARQSFAAKVGRFTSTEYKVDADMGIAGHSVLSSELFFESVPDDFIDILLKDWHYDEGSREIPIILPRTYINMYNFGFAQTHSLPKISDGLVGMIDFRIFIQGNGHNDRYKGRVVGLSNRLTTILVPQSFMDWSNGYYAPDAHSEPTRLLLEVSNPADENIAKYMDAKGYEVESDKLQAEKTTYFLRMIVSLVVAVGLVISVLSFYILMLSIYLLVQKNSSKLENLLLIGYAPSRVAMPYQMLAAVLNIVVLLLTLVLIYVVRGYYMGMIVAVFPQMESATLLPAVLVGLLLFVIVTVLNVLIIRNKVMKIWYGK